MTPQRLSPKPNSCLSQRSPRRAARDADGDTAPFEAGPRRSPVETEAIAAQAVTARWLFTARATEPPAIAHGELVLLASIAPDGDATVAAWIDGPLGRREVLRRTAARARVHRLNGHLHVDLVSTEGPAAAPLLSAVFRTSSPNRRTSGAPTGDDLDRAIYVRSAMPQIAGLAGATYDVPTATLGVA
ncbi:MAG: hypothetical protein U0575_14845 [Phycisphaerales bacterium]|jgi:hypothetical protein